MTDGTREQIATALSDSQARTWIWTPLGRVMWDEGTRNELLDRWAAPEGSAILLQAGFATGDPELLNLAVKHLRQQIEQRRVFPD